MHLEVSIQWILAIILIVNLKTKIVTIQTKEEELQKKKTEKTVYTSEISLILVVERFIRGFSTILIFYYY